MFEGVFFLTIVFANIAPGPYRDPYGPIEFSTFADCVAAGNALADWLGRDPFQILCTNQAGESPSTWFWPTPSDPPVVAEP